MKILFTPFLFLRIRFLYRMSYIFITPLIISLILTIIFFIFPGEIKISGQDSFFFLLKQVLPIIGGFFIAALTVILTNDHPILRKGMVGSEKPYLPTDKEEMTRARFLAALFGYLTFSSFLIFSIVSAIDLILPSIAQYRSFIFFPLSKILIFIFLAYWLAQMAFCMLIGLHYLTDRLYRSDGRANFSNELPPAE